MHRHHRLLPSRASLQVLGEFRLFRRVGRRRRGILEFPMSIIDIFVEGAVLGDVTQVVCETKRVYVPRCVAQAGRLHATGFPVL